MKRIWDCFVVAFAIILPLAAAAEGTKIAVEQPWARASVSKTGAVYLTVINSGNAGDAMVGASSPAAKKTEIHTTIVDNDVMKMRRLERIEIAPGERVVFEPGAAHVMLMGLTGPLREGETVTVTLTFERAGEIPVMAPIHKAGATMPAGAGMHGHDESMDHGGSD